MKKQRILMLMVCVLLAGGVLFAGTQLYRAANEKEQYADKGVFIGSIDVAGMNTEQATAAVNAYVENLKKQSITLEGPKGSVKFTMEELGLSANVEVAVKRAIGAAKAGDLISRFMMLKDLEKQNIVIDMGLKIDKQLTGNLINKKLDKLNVAAKDWGLKKDGGKFIVVQGESGKEVDIVASVNALSKMVADLQNGTKETYVFELNSKVTNPRGSEEELANVKDLMGHFSTWYSSDNEGRTKNLLTATSKLNGTVLYPGDVLSVHGVTSPYTEKNGYALGGSYSNGEVVESMGGGICQIVTTLYNAVIRAELQVTQRNAHSMTVSYVDLSADAAIAGTYKDLKFTNNYDYPIYIEGFCQNNTVNFLIYGKEVRDKDRTISFETEILKENDPGTAYAFSEEKPIGYFSQEKYKYVGYEAKYWKIVSVKGVETEKVLVNKSSYRASQGSVVIGIKGATPQQLEQINSAIASKDDFLVQAIVNSMATPEAPVAPSPETPAEPTPETPAETPAN